MDNVEPRTAILPVNDCKGAAILTLDAAQYLQYQTHCIEIHSPDGEFLQTIGKTTPHDDPEDKAFRLQQQISLVECLLDNINNDIDLPIPAALGLADLLRQARAAGYKRKQITKLTEDSTG